MDVTYKGPDGRLYRVSEQPHAKGGYYIEYRDPVTSAVYKPLPGCVRGTNRAEVVGWLDELVKGRGLVAAEDKPAAIAVPPAAEIAAPGFDFGADESTNTALLQCAQAFVAGRLAQVMAAKRAHELTANNKNGAFGKWCEAVGISRDTGNNLVNIADNFGNIELDGRPLVEITPISLLAIGSKPSAPQELKRGIESGDITTTKQYRELEAQLKAAREGQRSAETRAVVYEQKAAALEDAVKAAEDLKQKLYRRNEELAEKEQMLNVTMDQQGMYIAKMQEQESMLAELQDKLDDANVQLRAGPVTAEMVDPDEVERRARELAEQDGAKWEELCQNQQATIMRLQKGSDIIARVSAVNDTVEAILDQLYAAINDAPYTTELCAAVLTLGDALGDYYADFSAFCGEEGCEDE